MIFVLSMVSRDSILLGLDLSRIGWLSMPTGPWNRVSSPCCIKLVYLCLSGVRPLLPLSMSETGHQPLLCLARHPGQPSLASSLMSPCFVSGAVLPMSISRRTRGSGGVLGPAWRSASSLDIPLTRQDAQMGSGLEVEVILRPVTKTSLIIFLSTRKLGWQRRRCQRYSP